ncbi:MAG: helix-turn-helix domain-containing protein [Candidatus Sumerlaeia bacterium]|nr:helix-turn-helix domain-containing protein [Candidatus Sumerlaeia bacterium]
MKRFVERRSGRDRRDWDVFFFPNRRSGKERRSGKDRRERQEPPPEGLERRQIKSVETPTPPPQPLRTATALDKPYYTTAEVAEITGLSQTTLLLWIRNKLIDGSRIKRSVEGKRLWSREDIAEIERVKARNGWAR